MSSILKIEICKGSPDDLDKLITTRQHLLFPGAYSMSTFEPDTDLYGNIALLRADSKSIYYSLYCHTKIEIFDKTWIIPRDPHFTTISENNPPKYVRFANNKPIILKCTYLPIPSVKEQLLAYLDPISRRRSK